ncbi:MAG: 16S rRNA processing protein RimM [Selenomonadaceae bacterium]|nr:16S rRNA processing protein RimM [Selenomonadaceae bacterium]
MTKSLQFAGKNLDEIIIGKLGKVRGLGGELRIIPLTDFEGRFDDLKEIFVGGKLMPVASVNHIGEEIFIKFAGIDNRESAKTLTNKFLTVPRSQAAPLDEGEFYTFDIIGCEVFAGDKKIGVVNEVLKTGSNDVFQVKGETEILIPALKSVVEKIDVANKKIFISDEWSTENVG